MPPTRVAFEHLAMAIVAGHLMPWVACEVCDTGNGYNTSTSIYQILKQGFQDMGLSGPWNIASKTGNPVSSILVSEYLSMLREKQGSCYM